MFFRKRDKREIDEIDSDNIPKHIAIIMDGNGRWASKRGLPRSIGHREGSNTLKKITRACDEIGIKYLTVFAFSTENWSRPKEEVDTLMDLLLESLRNADKDIGGKNVRITVIGNVDGLPEKFKKEIERVTENTKNNNGLTLAIALNYGGRDDIVNAVKNISKDVAGGNIKLEDINEQLVSNYLYTSEMPDPDLVIRPSGEHRISNFLLWQSSYAEFWYSEILWPDFTKNDLIKAIIDYQNRNRRFGGV